MDDSCLRNRLAFAPSHIRAIELQIELCGVLYTICGERLLIVPRTRCSIRLNVSIGCERRDRKRGQQAEKRQNECK